MKTVPSGTWIIDPTHSEVTFSVRHLMISKVKGSFNTFEGKIVTNGTPEETKVEGKIDTASVDTNDKNRDGHLASPEFFDVEQFPEMSFVSTKVETKGKEDYVLVGELTIKGVTKEVKLDVEFGGIAVDPYGQTKAAASAKTKISRSDFGLTWNVALESGGVLVGDDITINLDIQAALQA